MSENNPCLSFNVLAWSVWPPLTGGDAQDLAVLQKDVLAFMPMHLKRRLSPLAKTVFCALTPCAVADTSIPVVFSSSHGELAKSLELIKLIEAGEEISPTTFSLSVHNAIAGLFSIAFGYTSEVTVLAPGEEGIAPAFLEAMGLLHEGAAEVLMVFYDEPLPDFYPTAPFQLSADTACAVALRIAKAGTGTRLQFSRGNGVGYQGEQPAQLPLFSQFLSGTAAELTITTPRQSWHWQKLPSTLNPTS